MIERMNTYRSHFVIIFLYGLLTVIMTWPLAARLGSHIPGLIGDSFVHLWTFELVKQSLISGHSPIFTDLLFFPQGTTLVFHNFAWINILGWLILQTFVDGAAAYSLIHMAVLVFNGYATYLLARELTQSDRASFLAGMVCAFWPFILSHQDHPNLIFIGWIALVLLFLKRMFENGQVKDALLVALFLVLTGITRWQLLIMAAPLVGLFVIYAFIADKQTRTWHTLKQLLMIVVITVLFLLPLMAPLIYSQFTRSFPDDLFVTENLYITDLMGYLVPSRYHPIWGEAAFSVTWRFAGNMSYVPFLGYTTLILAVIGLIGERRKARFWGLAALVYAVLALGPSLYVYGRPTSIPLPFALIDEIFLVQAIRFPERLNVMLSIPMAVLAGFGVLVLLRNPKLQSHKNLVTIGLSLLLIVEYIITFPTLELTTPDWYEQVQQEEGSFAILDVPMNMREIWDKQYMYYQATHGKPIVEGHVSRPPREAFDFIESLPILREIRDQRMPPENLGDISQQLQLLNEADIRYLVLHKKFLRDSHEEAWRAWLALDPFFEDEEIIVYPTDPAILKDYFDLDEIVLIINGDPQLGVVQVNYEPKQTIPGGWVTVDIWWGTRLIIDEDLFVCLNLVDENGSSSETYCDDLVSSRPISQWEANEIVRTRLLFQVDPELKTGIYSLNANLQDAAGEEIGHEVVLGDLLIETTAHSFTKPDPNSIVGGQWQDLISLIGFDQSMSDDSMNLTLYWQALNEMDTSYKIFLHLTDGATGELMAQIDYVPQSWRYPTNWWVEGEFITDPVSFPLDNLPEGEYQIWVGIYDPDTGDRIIVSDKAGNEYQGGTLPLLRITQ